MDNASALNIYSYPAKSMMGEALSEVGVGETGISGNRRWAAWDENPGDLRGKKKISQMLALAPQPGLAT